MAVTTAELGTAPPATGAAGAPGRRARAVAFAMRHPVLVVAGIALAARVVLAAVVVLTRDGTVVPDEMQYIELATYASDGRGVRAWQIEYGPELFSSTGTFMYPLTAMFEVFGAWRFWGQLLAALGGAITAGATVVVARRFVRPGWAVVAGLVVALWPSQMLWSSIVLRDSLVWAALSLLAVAVLAASSARTDSRVALAVASIGVLLFLLAHLREQTFLAVSWALILVTPFVRGHRRVPRTAAIALLALLVPITIDDGVGGWLELERAAPSLARIRVGSASNADTAFLPEVTVAPSTTAPPGGSGSGGGGRAVDSTTTTIPEFNDPDLDTGGPRVVAAPDGRLYEVEESVGGNLEHLPRGLVAILGRPFPWEGTGGDLDLTLARVETGLWLIAYALVLAGVWALRRQWRELAFPLAAAAVTVGIAALVQGNLGTAFRHRGQVLWFVAIAAVAGAQHLVDARRRRVSAR